jgi:uncharacterized protein (TIGR00725 family)
LKYQFCVSGAAAGASAIEGKNLAKTLGVSIAKSKQALLTGASNGLSNAAARGYKQAGGSVSVGISPAASKVEHIVKYNLPVEPYHSILYTGLNYVGRDVLLISSSDAVICVGGRIGTLHEFAIAMETEKPIGFLQGAGGISDEILSILHAADKNKTKDIIFSEDPDEIVNGLIDQLNEKYNKYKHLYR